MVNNTSTSKILIILLLCSIGLTIFLTYSLIQYIYHNDSTSQEKCQVGGFISDFNCLEKERKLNNSYKNIDKSTKINESYFTYRHQGIEPFIPDTGNNIIIIEGVIFRLNESKFNQIGWKIYENNSYGYAYQPQCPACGVYNYKESELK